MTGTLTGVGLGPGDPDLITLRAARLIQAAPVIAYPAPDTGTSFARAIAADLIPEAAVEIAITVPMRAARFPAQAVYDQAAADVARHLSKGRDVVVLCEGDPFFYGSFMYLYDRLKGDFPTQVVPGVTSLTTCAARAARPLCARNEPLTILPAPLDDAALTARLQQPGAVALMKVGRHLDRLRRLLGDLGLARRAVYVAHASLPQETVLPLDQAPAPAPYFSMILIPGQDPYAAS
ncbi:MAG: precorrin-2 C(20)-methyltransferase [Pseudomonadota bacterium]